MKLGRQARIGCGAASNKMNKNCIVCRSFTDWCEYWDIQIPAIVQRCFTTQSIWLTICPQRLRKPQCLDVKRLPNHIRKMTMPVTSRWKDLVRIGFLSNCNRTHTRLFKLSRPKGREIPRNFPLTSYSVIRTRCQIPLPK